MKKADHALDKAKVQLIVGNGAVFLSTILFSLKFKWDETIPTACTNGLELRVNPDFFLSLPEKQRIFVLAHEAFHVVFMHMARVGKRDFQLWNMAADYVINLMLKDAGYELWPPCCISEDYRGMISEQVYDILDKDPSKQPVDFEPDMEQIDESEPATAETIREIENIIVRATIQATEQGEAGTIPNSVNRFLSRLLNPKLPWHRILSRVLNGYAKDDYSYRKPNRRHLPELYLPTLYSESVGDICCCVDVSGSVGDQELLEFVSEVRAINNQLKPSKMTITAFDHKITCEYNIKEHNNFNNIDFKGGGGTNINAVMDWVRERKPAVMVIFTDGCFWEAPDMTGIKAKLFWIIKDNPGFMVNKGKVIHY